MVEELELLSTVESEGKKEQNESEKMNESTSFYLQFIIRCVLMFDVVKKNSGLKKIGGSRFLFMERKG